MKMENSKIYEYIVEKYMNLVFHVGRYNDHTHTEKHHVYDHLGMIDTLGHTTDIGDTTYSYSDEGGSIFAFLSLSLNKWFVAMNYYGQEAEILSLEEFNKRYKKLH